ncbi:hypothetical protein ACROYT_G001660 [Oculina patagonica]
MCDVTHCKKCVASQWTQWNQCSAPCGINGYQSRTRLVYRPPSCGEESCRDLTTKEWRPCNRFCHNGGTPGRWACACPLNYIGDCCETGFLGWSSWGDWGQCNKSCGSGVQKRMRVCIASPPFNASVCDSICPGPSLETRECNTQECQVQYDSLGCFRDDTPRSLPLLLKSFRGNIDWNNMAKVVQACADITHERGLVTFGIQFYGECWSGVNASETYDMHGPSKNCWSGVGKEGSYYVYKLKV